MTGTIRTLTGCIRDQSPVLFMFRLDIRDWLNTSAVVRVSFSDDPFALASDEAKSKWEPNVS